MVFVLFAVFMGGLPATAFAQDFPGSKDHPMIKRYQGSVITLYRVKDFEEYALALGKLVRKEQTYMLEKTQRLEGKITHIEYKTPRERSVLEIFRNYEMALKKAGFQTLFTCSNMQGTCGSGGGGGGPAAEAGLGYYGTGWESRYIAAKLVRPEGDVYVALNVMEEVTHLNVVEVKPMETGLVTVDAAAMAGDIARTGHVAIYGILFDFNKADVKPESEPAIREIAKLLKQDPKLKLHVVGHTDSVGELKFNMDLSRRRADAVVKVLTTKHGIAVARLRAEGVGPLSPVASNRTEEGRAKNRRVELVEQ
jgi:outer membrane protein OmpA-like peptidoglycan-associated protein